MLSRTRFVALSLALDAFFIAFGFVAAFYLRFYREVIATGALPARNFEAFLVIAPVVVLIYLGAGWTYGLYDPERTETLWTVVRSVFSAVFLGTVLVAALAFLGGQRTEAFARYAMAIGAVLNVFLLIGWRWVFLRVGRVHWPEQRVILVGTGPVTIELAQEMERRAQWGWRVCGLLDPDPVPAAECPTSVGGYPVLGSAHDVALIAAQQKANRIVVVSPIALRELVESLVLADEIRVRVDVVPELYEIFIGRVDALIGDIPLMKITESFVPRYYRAAKRALDLAGALVLLVVVSPVLLLSALAIVLTDGLPVLFKQERIGRDLRPFTVYKLRTMVKDAERLSGPVLAEEDDPRITRVGRFLRSYRIDELPQLLNIIKGNMSFVGPRPERGFFVETYLAQIPGYRERFRVKPGVTGLAQVSGGYATTPDRKLKYDLIYMFHQNFAMDAQILAETLRVVLTGRGAR
jgi:exopolysaccharide biosynthesis polyprenyl glycosylphosphotransferase